MDSKPFVDVNISGRRQKLNFVRRDTLSTKLIEICYMHSGNKIVYDRRTMNYYKTIRQCHIDPILNIEVDEKIAFKFPYQWDAYTGERTGVDPFGSLYFNPIRLVYYYYIHRLDGLWNNAVDTLDGYYEGYYDMLVGTGQELDVVGRDKYMELYLFRLPITDCYLTTEHKKSIITLCLFFFV